VMDVSGQVSQMVKDLRAVFNSGKTHSAQWARTQLMAIKRCLLENKESVR